MVTHYVNFGYPDTVLALLTGFDLEDSSPVDGVLKNIIIDSPSEFVGIACSIDEVQILPQEGEITIRTAVKYPINRRVNQKDRLVVALNNHDGVNPHTPSIVWEIDDEIEKEVGEVLSNAINKARMQERIVGKCNDCGSGNLMILYSRKTRKRFIGCTNYFKGLCKTSFSLPQRGTVKPVRKNCNVCDWPIVQIRMKGKRPWMLCFNSRCPLKEEKT